MNQTIDGILKEVFEVLMTFHHVVYHVTPSIGISEDLRVLFIVTLELGMLQLMVA
jgi:hypothetical protein